MKTHFLIEDEEGTHYRKVYLPKHRLNADDFPEGKKMLSRLLKETNKKLSDLDIKLKLILTNEELSDDAKMFLDQVMEHIYYETLFKEKARLVRELSYYNRKKSNNFIEIENLKDILIQDLFDMQKPRRAGNKISCKCPFHDEKLPSFFIYTKTNTYHCFSCKAGGDVIDFVMKLHQKDFKSAIKYLSEFKGVI